MEELDEIVPAPLEAEFATYADSLWTAAPRLMLAIVVLVLAWIIIRLVDLVLRRVLARLRIRRSLINLFEMLVNVGGWSLTILIAMAIVFPSVTPAKALTALGLGSVAIGFAFKGFLENLLAGIFILLREPFRIGDYIGCEEIDGRVERINTRETWVRQTDDQLVVVPNGYLYSNPVTVRTNAELRRAAIICGVAYGEDVDEARRVIYEAVKAVDTVRNDVQDLQVFAKEFGASSVDFEVAWWTGSRPIDIRRSRDQVVAAIKRALDEHGIEIPFPYRTLTFKEPLAFTRAKAESGGTENDGTDDAEPRLRGSAN